MSHECFKRFDEVLANHNGRLAFSLQVTDGLGLRGRLLIATEKLNKAIRKPVPNVVATHCPFCGVHLDSEGGEA